MATQLIRLSQIKANLPEFMDFEQQLVAMFGDDNTEKFIAAEGQQIFTLSREYEVSKNAIKVFVNGILQVCGSADGYIEMNPRMISFTEPLFKGDCVVIVRNQFISYARRMGRERVKAYNIDRVQYFVTVNNQDNLIYDTPIAYQVGLNQLKVYVNGLLQTCGQGFDYVEFNENQFKFNYKVPVGSSIIAEVTAGGLKVYKSERSPIFIDSGKVNQREFTLITPYKVGTNNLKLYLNGVLLRKGTNNDYVELNSYSFKMNYDLKLGDLLLAEVTTFTVDVFSIIRNEKIVTEQNINDTTFKTPVNYILGESNLRVYLNGVLLREGADEDYTEIDNQTFEIKHPLEAGMVIEYEIVYW